jgi:hypothetical protein
MPPICLVATFWGPSFTSYLCRYAIPSLLAPGNIDALSQLDRASFLFCTTEDDWEHLKAQPIFALLERKIKVELVPITQKSKDEHKYHRMSRGHALLAQRCFETGAIAININPDSIYPDGSLATAQLLAAAGNRVVLCTAIRFDMDGVHAELVTDELIKPDAPLIVSKRDAVDIGLRNLHPESRASIWSAKNFGRLHPSHGRRFFLTCCIWKVPDENGAIIITHNWAPFMVNYSTLSRHDVGALDGRALDGNYIFENFWRGNFDGIHISQDSDELFMLGLTPRDEMVPPQDAPLWLNTANLEEWSKGYVLNRTVYDPAIDEMRREAYRIPVQWHPRDINARWQPKTCDARRLIDKYVRRDLKASEHQDLRSSSERRWHTMLGLFFR